MGGFLVELTANRPAVQQQVASGGQRPVFCKNTAHKCKRVRRTEDSARRLRAPTRVFLGLKRGITYGAAHFSISFLLRLVNRRRSVSGSAHSQVLTRDDGLGQCCYVRLSKQYLLEDRLTNAAVPKKLGLPSKII